MTASRVKGSLADLLSESIVIRIMIQVHIFVKKSKAWKEDCLGIMCSFVNLTANLTHYNLSKNGKTYYHCSFLPSYLWVLNEMASSPSYEICPFPFQCWWTTLSSRRPYQDYLLVFIILYVLTWAVPFRDLRGNKPREAKNCLIGKAFLKIFHLTWKFGHVTIIRYGPRVLLLFTTFLSKD